MKKIIVVMILLALSVSACGSASPAPAMNSNDVQATAGAAALTVVAQTQAAVPTDTAVPPTETPTQTPLPTNTPEASPTAGELASPTIVLPTEIPSLVPQTNTSGDPCNKPLTSWQGPTSTFFINYEYKPQGKHDTVVLSLFVVTDTGECGFLADVSQGPIGQYTAAAYVNGEKDFKVFGGFRINGGNWRIIIRNDVIVAKGSCYPNC